MALYKYDSFNRINHDAVFDQINSPGTAAPRSGIYRCDLT